jgi:hypothetical protein
VDGSTRAKSGKILFEEEEVVMSRKSSGTCNVMASCSNMDMVSPPMV